MRVEGSDLQHGKHGELRDLRDHYQHTMSQLYDILSERLLYGARAEHADNLQTKFEKSTVTATMFCQYPITSLKRDRPMVDATGTRKDREYTIKPISLLIERRRKGTNQYGIDS